MSLFGKVIEDDAKTLELAATLVEFMDEATEDEGQSYGYEEAKNSLIKKEKTLRDLKKLNVKTYSNCVDKGLLRATQNVKKALIRQLDAWIQEDRLATSSNFNPYTTEALIREARLAEYSLGMAWTKFKTELKSYTERYEEAHGGRPPIWDEKKSIRWKLK